MEPFKLRDALYACGGTYYGDEKALDADVTTVVTDSRQAAPGALFVALKGARADGHAYMAAALQKGALCCLSEREPGPNETPTIVVPSALFAVGRVAGLYRARFNIPVIGITGSVGKTTTKEMIASVLSRRFVTHKTLLNHNNELGVPQTLFALEKRHEAAVVEMGVSDFGEMARLTDIVKPTIAVMTLIGDAHLEFFGDRAGVLRAKSEIFSGMDPGALAVVNGDDPLLSAFAPPVRRITFGRGADCDWRAADVVSRGAAGTDCVFIHRSLRFPVSIPAYGAHLVYAALAAAAVGDALGLSPAEIAAGVADYAPVAGRARVLVACGMRVVDDCYNANPNSVCAALDALAEAPGRRVAILGDMLELGPAAPALHAAVGRHAASRGVDLVVGCGELSQNTVDGAREGGAEALYIPGRDAVIARLGEFLRPGDTVLVKASHSRGFDKIVEAIVGREA